MSPDSYRRDADLADTAVSGAPAHCHRCVGFPKLPGASTWFYLPLILTRPQAPGFSFARVSAPILSTLPTDRTRSGIAGRMHFCTHAALPAECAAMRILFHILSMLPLRVLHALGDLLGWLLWILPNGRRNTSLRNLELCFPQMRVAERRRLARISVQNEVKTILEMPVAWLASEKRVLGMVREWRGGEVIDQALAQGKGMLLLTLHQGNWEACAIPFSKKYTATGLYKPQKGAINDLSLQGRCRFGGKMLPAEGGVGREIVKVLARNETVYFMPDQDPPPGRGVFAPFFGVPAHTPTLVSKLAQKHGVPVVFFYGERLPRGQGFIAHWFAADPAIYSEDLQTSVAAMNAGLERCARASLEQYWWGYKRFRRRPEGEPTLYS